MVRHLGNLSALLCILCPAVAFAQVPQIIIQEGVLSGDDVGDEVDLVFSFYARAAGGEAIWEEDHDGIELGDGGYYTVALGSVEELTDADLLQAGYMGVSVDGEALSPRIRLGSSPFARIARSLSGGTVDASSISVGGEVVIDAEGNWQGNAEGLRGPEGPAGERGPAGEEGPPGNQGSPDEPADILRKLRTLEGPLDLEVADAADAARLGGRLAADYLRKAEVGVDIAGGAIGIANSAFVLKRANAREQISSDEGTATVANDAEAGALVVAGRVGDDEDDRRIELRGRTQVTGNLVASGSTVLRGGLYVSNAGGGVRQVIDANGRWVPNAVPNVGQQCEEDEFFRGLADDGSFVCGGGDAAPGECGLPIPCDVEDGWAQREFDEDTETWSPCILKGCFRPAELVVVDRARPWRNVCREDEDSDETCNDGRDNDGDGLTDCSDPNCNDNPDVGICSRDLEVGANQVFNINTQDASGEGGRDAPAYRLAQNVAAEARQLVLDSVPRELVAGDEILIITIKRVNGNENAVGLYETGRIAAVEGQRVTVREGLAFGYPGATDVVIVQRVPTYSGVRIRSNGVMTARAFNGSVGGIFAIRVTGLLVIDQGGRIDMDNKGFRGGRIGAGEGFAEDFSGRLETGGGDASGPHGGGTPDQYGRGGQGGYCYYRGHEGRGGPSSGTVGRRGQAGGAGGYCHQYFDEPQWSGGGGAPRDTGENPTVPQRVGTRIYMGGGGANGGGGGASGNYYRCRGDRGGKRDGRGGVTPGGCSNGNSIGGSGGDGQPGGNGGGIVLIWASSVTAQAGITLSARGGKGGAAGGGGGGAHINGGGGGGAGGGGASGGSVLVQAATRRIGTANIAVTGGIGGGGGGGGGSAHAGPGGAGAGPDGGGGGAGVYYGDRGCRGTRGGDGGQAGSHNNGAGNTGGCRGRACDGRGGAVGGGGGGGGYGTDPAGARNRGGRPGCYTWSGHRPTAGGDAPGRDGGNGGWGPVHTAGGAGGRWGRNGDNGVKAIRPL